MTVKLLNSEIVFRNANSLQYEAIQKYCEVTFEQVGVTVMIDDVCLGDRRYF